MVDKTEEEKEVWKTYSDYPFIEASNLGRIRTKDRYVTVKGQGKRLVKGKVLKQRLRPDGYMEVNFKVKNKPVKLLTHRVIAASHLQNPNNLPEVNHKDNDRTNNVVSNLEWCTREYNQDYKEQYGMSAAEVVGRPVIAVNLETGRVLRFETRSEAARQLGVDDSAVNAVVKGRKPTAGGYWFTEDKNEITEEKIKEIKKKANFLGPVVAINQENYEVLWFESQSEAARQLGIDDSHINKVIKDKQNKTHGYWFCRVDEYAVEKTREKFSDEVAKKVEKLTHQNKN